MSERKIQMPAVLLVDPGALASGATGEAAELLKDVRALLQEVRIRLAEPVGTILTEGQAMRRIGVDSHTTMKRLRDEECLPWVPVGRLVGYLPAALEEWARRRQRTGRREKALAEV